LIAAGIQSRRPVGITVLVVLQIIAGAFNVVLSVLLAAVYAFALVILGVPNLGIFLAILAFVLFVLGVFSFVIAYGLWSGKHWAWVATVVLAILGLVSSSVGLIFGNLFDIVSITLYAITLAYLMTSSVRFYFGRATNPPTYYQSTYSTPYQGRISTSQNFQSPTPPYTQPSYGLLPGRIGLCPNCFSTVDSTQRYCSRCGFRYGY
jgi:vacuolar-type H+-ATPase subunit I/STV1